MTSAAPRDGLHSATNLGKDAAKTFILMGVSGCGKSTIGRAVSLKLAIPFLDGDDYHTLANKEKMLNGQPLDDADRMVWLRTISSLAQWFHDRGQRILIGCSALKPQYRQVLAQGMLESTWFIHLMVPFEVAQARVQSRQGHFFKPCLLKSQFQSLCIPESEEFHVIQVDASQLLEPLVNMVCDLINNLEASKKAET